MRRLVVPLIAILFILILVSPTALSSTASTRIHEEQSKFIVSQNEGYTHHDPISILDNGEFSQSGFPGSGTYEDPYLIEGLNITNNDRCIWISNTDSYFRIRNCFLLGVALDAPLRLENVTNGVFEECIIEGGDIGIYLQQCSSIIIRGSTIAGSHAMAILVERCDNNITISDNRIFECLGGIYVDFSHSCVISRNRIYCNTFGINLTGETSHNEVYQNSLGWNIHQFAGVAIINNANDFGSNNTWNGNSWCDCSTSLYYIRGEANSYDDSPSPLIDTVAPVISGSDMNTISEDNISAILSWNIIDAFPVSYEILQNGVTVDSGYLTRNLTWRLESLSLGNHIFTILVSDGFGSIATFQNIVNVVLPLHLYYTLVLSVGIFAIPIVLVTIDYLRMKRKDRNMDASEDETSKEKPFDISQLLD